MAKGLFGGGTGTVADPYLIEDAYDLNAIRFNLAKSFKLVYNINLDVPPYNKSGWEPIPGSFTGSLDGNQKKIFNLYVNKPDQDYVGLFKKITLDYTQNGNNYNAKISNISIENARIYGRRYVGVLAGYCYIRAESSVNIYDSSALVLEKIHISGDVHGLSYVGGMFGQLYYYSLSGYSWRFVEDCLIDITLNVQTDQTICGLMIGQVSSNLLSYPRFCDIVCKGYYIFAGATVQYASSILNKDASGVAPIMENVIYDKTIWNGKETSGSVGKTSDRMKLKEEFSNLELKKTSAGASTWIFGYGRYPRLWYLEQNNLFVKADGKYMIYDSTSKQWTVKYSNVPSLLSAMCDGMKNLDNVERNAWDQLKSQYASVEIVNIIDKSVGLLYKDYAISLGREAAKDYGSKQIYRKEMAVNDFEDGIFNMETL
jgi:hypothetical protein